VRRALPPLLFPLVVGAMLAYVLATPALDLAGALDLPAGANIGLRPVSAILIFYPLIALLERLFPHRPEWNRSHGDIGADVLHLAITGPLSQTLVGAVVVGPLAMLSVWVAGLAGGTLWPSQLPMLVQLALALVLGELGHYVFHRISHENHWVWRLHAAHHGARRLYWLNATRFHVLDLFLVISCESLPLALLGAGAEVLGPYFAFRAVYGQVQHCNVEMPTPRWIDWLWSSPNVHRWHHSTVSDEGNNNYGAVLNVWDHVFRSFFRPDAPFAGRVGIGQIPNFPTSYLGQQLSPFRWAKIPRADRSAEARAR
jgi:sterol desaturase/sphingolipid hydroxylase (fatty acid hydroxylase superfamily)